MTTETDHQQNHHQEEKRTMAGTEEPAREDRAPVEPSLYKATASAAHRLQGAVLGADRPSSSTAKATLSRLRRAVGQEPGADPRSWWEVTEQMLGELPEKDLGRGDEASHSEWAAFVAITLFSLHQQSQHRPMHVAGVSLGKAVGTLKHRAGSESIKPRLDAVMVASTEAGIRYHIRSLIGLLRAHEIPLDYGRLAEDLRHLRHPERRRETVIRWGRDYARALHRASSAPSES